MAKRIPQKTVRVVGMMVALFGMGGVPQLVAAQTMESVRQQFIGDYELLSYIQYPEQSEPVDMQYIGRLSYDAFGNMAGLGMPKDLPAQDARSAERLTGGFAYWGKVSYDLPNSRVIHHVQGSPMIPRWVGGDNIRYYEFEGDLLRLSLKNSEGRITGTLTWRRLQ